MYELLRVKYPDSDLRSTAYTHADDDSDDNSSSTTSRSATPLPTPTEPNYFKRPASPSWDEGQRDATRPRRSPSPCFVQGSSSGNSLRSTPDVHAANSPRLTFARVEAPSYSRTSPTPSSSTAITGYSGTTLTGTPYPEAPSYRILSTAPSSRPLHAVRNEEKGYLSDTITQPSSYSSAEVSPTASKPTSSVSSVAQAEPIKIIRVSAECTLSDKDLCELGPGLSQAITKAREDYEAEKKHLQALAQVISVRCPHRVQPTPEKLSGRCDDLVLVRDLTDHLRAKHKDTFDKAVKGTAFPCPFHSLSGKKACQDINKRKEKETETEVTTETDSSESDKATKMTTKKGAETKKVKEGDGNLIRHLRSMHLNLGSEEITVNLTVDAADYPIRVKLPLGGRTDLTNRAYGHAVLRVIQELQRKRKVALPEADVYAKWAGKSKLKTGSSRSVTPEKKVTASGSKVKKVAAPSSKAKKTYTLRSKAKVAAAKSQRAKAKKAAGA